MTLLSVNVNKIALLRNSRGRDFPSVLEFVDRCLSLGVQGITVHPRPDQRHITRRDVYELAAMLALRPEVEFNIEGYPSREFIDMVIKVTPSQCTLVPDAPGQLTSDHGWNVGENRKLLTEVLDELREAGIRSCLFMDAASGEMDAVKAVRSDRVELYTEAYAAAVGHDNEAAVWERYRAAAARAAELDIGVNAGHDLSLDNLQRFLQIPGILEVSIGHALIVECLQLGLPEVIKRYLAITGTRARKLSS